MSASPTFTTALARLVPAAPGLPARRYRPLVAGPAILERPPGAPEWTVRLASDRLLLPRVPRAAAARRTDVPGCRNEKRRVAAVLAGPLDGPAPCRIRFAPRFESPRRMRLDIYGWALMYQPPGMQGRAVVDADDRFADLPAVFELPFELLDRAEFLESRGFRTRPLVIPTAPADFEPGPDGRLRNRFFPEADLRLPRGLDLLR